MGKKTEEEIFDSFIWRDRREEEFRSAVRLPNDSYITDLRITMIAMQILYLKIKIGKI